MTKVVSSGDELLDFKTYSSPSLMLPELVESLVHVDLYIIWDRPSEFFIIIGFETRGTT